MGGGALRGLWRALGSRAGRATLTGLACVGIVLAVASFVSLFVGIARQLNGPVIQGPSPAAASLAAGRYVIYQRFTGDVRRDQDGAVVGPLHQPGQLTAGEILLTSPSGADVPVSDRGSSLPPSAIRRGCTSRWHASRPARAVSTGWSCAGRRPNCCSPANPDSAC